MDYNSLKKLAVVMGEEFKVIDSVTLEAINVQRLITKEKEYCSNLEGLINTYASDINALENEAKSLKCKLDESINKGLLLKSSLESLKSSHIMVELLKVDLKKQLKLEMIKTTEQNIKFDSTIKKYEEMWENYKYEKNLVACLSYTVLEVEEKKEVWLAMILNAENKLTYQKFPLVYDLHKIQSKLKQKSIHLAMQEKNIEDYKTKIETLSHIKDKREKIIILKIAEKYLQREKQNTEKKALEENIRVKRENFKNKKLDESQNLPSGYSGGVLMPNFKSNEYSSDSLPYLMADLIVEFNKENISFNASNSSVHNPSRATFHRYEAVLNRGVRSVPLLKLPPLPLLDSPPRKVRSVGNLLSPPKHEWSKENSKENLIKPLHPVNSESNAVSTPDISFIDMPSSEIEKVEDEDDKVRDIDNQDLGLSSSADILDHTENNILVDDPQTEMELETQISEARIDLEESTVTFEKTENIQINFNEAENADQQSMKEVNFKNDNAKPALQMESIDFTYEPRPEKPVSKGNENLPPVSKSPYFASSYMNFMEVPQKSEGNFEKERRVQRVSQKAESVKDKIPVVDLTDDENKESKRKQGNKSELKNINPREEVAYPIDVDHSHDQQHSFTTQSSGMEVDDVNTSLNSGSVYFSADDKGVENDKYKTDNNTIQESPAYPVNENEIHSFQPNVTQEDPNLSYGSPMDFSQVSYADSLDYPDTTYASLSPDNRSFVNSPPYLPSPAMDKHEHSDIFGSPSGFNYAFAGHPQQSSASALFGSASSADTKGKERKQSEVFNFAFDTKSKTPTMFKLF